MFSKFPVGSLLSAYGRQVLFCIQIILIVQCRNPAEPDGSTGTLTDIDGNMYKTVKIGNQWWMAENLKVTHYNDGSPIQYVSEDSTWKRLSNAYFGKGACCAYENNESNKESYWFFIRTPKPVEDSMIEQHFVSYYNQGMLLGLLLDLEIRHTSGGKHSLDDVLAALYDRFYVSKAESYYLQGRGYDAEDFQRIAEEMAGTSLDQFFSAYVRGTEPLDYDRFLVHAGLKLQKTEYLKPGEVGILWQEGGVEALQIKHIEPNSVADEAVLDRGDIVLGVNDYMVTQSKWESRFEDLKEGDPLKFLVERRGRVLEFSTPYRLGKGISYDIVPLDAVTEAQSTLRKEWLAED